jgi:hypothetical protein
VTVNYTTTDGTATAGSDYQATSGTLTLAPGQTSAKITVPVLATARWGADKTFTVTLSGVSGAPVAHATAVGTIVNGNTPMLYDFGTSDSPVAAGYAQVTPNTVYSSTAHFGWLSGSIDARDRGAESATNDLTRDFDFTPDGTFAVDLPDGTYNVTVTIGDDYARGPEGVYLQGTQVDTVSTAAYQFVNRTYRVTITNGQLDLELKDLSGGGAAIINGLAIATVGTTAAASATFLGSDGTTQGSWQGAYGADGYQVAGDQAALPGYAAVSVSGASPYVWAASTTDPTALQKAAAGSTDRVAACWYSPTSFTIDVNLTDGRAHRVALYAADFYAAGRSERVDVIDAGTGAVLDSRTLSSFVGGDYLSWTLGGHVQLRVTDLAGPNAVVGGLFFG